MWWGEGGVMQCLVLLLDHQWTFIIIKTKTRLKRARQKYPIVKKQDKLYIKMDKMHRNSALSIKALHGVENKTQKDG